MVVNGIFDKIGDELIVQLEGIQYCTSLDSFTDTTQNEINERYFEKYFRYSQNEKVSFSNWYTLTNQILQGISLDPTLNTYIEVRYVATGTDNSARLMWKTFDLTVTLTNSIVDTFYPIVFTNSNQMFGDISVNDPTLRQVVINVTAKALKYIYPKFIIRTDDLKLFTETITTYFALFYVKAKKLYEYYNSSTVLLNYLEKQGLYFSGNESLTELRVIADNLLGEYMKRGTKNTIFEIKRLINYQLGDIFIFEVLKSNETGWFLDKTSPMYRGLEYVSEINQMIDKEDVQSLDNYYTSNISGLSVIADTYNGNNLNVIKISNSNNTGIGGQPFIQNDIRNIEVDTTYNYEISFRLKQPTPSNMLKFGVQCFDSTGALLGTLNITDGNINDYFFADLSASHIYPENDWVKVKGIIFNENEPIRANNYTLNIQKGVYKKFPVNTKYIYPIIQTFDGNSLTVDVRIFNIRVALLNYYPFVSFINNSRYILNLLINNSNKYTDSEVEEIISRYLIPFNSNFVLN